MGLDAEVLWYLTVKVTAKKRRTWAGRRTEKQRSRRLWKKAEESRKQKAYVSEGGIPPNIIRIGRPTGHGFRGGGCRRPGQDCEGGGGSSGSQLPSNREFPQVGQRNVGIGLELGDEGDPISVGKGRVGHRVGARDSSTRDGDVV